MLGSENFKVDIEEAILLDNIESITKLIDLIECVLA